MSVLLLLLMMAFPAAAQIEGTNWFPIGPAPIEGFFAGGATGRGTAIAVNPMNANDVWVGTAAGGVWHTRNAGVTWEPESDFTAALAVGSIALDGCTATDCANIYVGTGENAIRRDTLYGAGLLVGGTTGGEFPQFVWTQRTGSPVADFRFGSINDVVLDPTTSGGTKRVFVTFSSGETAAATESTITAPAPMGGYGIYRSNDMGATWTKLTVAGSNNARPTDLEMRPDDHMVLFAGFLGRGVFRSTDNGTTWCPLNAGIAAPVGCLAQTLPNIGSLQFDHVEIAIAPSANGTVYASFGRCADPLIQNCRAAVWRSTDGGMTWSQRNAGDPNQSDLTSGRGYSRYTHVLTVDPASADRLFLGGVPLWRSTDGGMSYSESDSNLAPPPGSAILHSDHHEVVFAPSQPTRAYTTGDGGFAFSDTSGTTWRPRNDDLQITEFQGIGASPLTISVIGASQDNAGQLWDGGSRKWRHLSCCGDGGFAFLDWDEALVMYAGSNFGALKRSTDGGMSFFGVSSALWSGDPRLFYAPFVQGPNAVSGNHPLFFGSNRLFRSTTNGNSWEQISPVLATGNFPEIVTATDTDAQVANPTGGQNAITAIAQSASDPNRIYIGYYGGEVFRSDGAPCTMASCWKNIGAGLPDFPITRIAVHPTQPDTAYVTISGFGNHARVWKTTTGGMSWTAVTTGLPAGVPANTVILEPSTPQRVYVGLDSSPTGSSLYRSTNGGTSFDAFSQGLPNAPIYELAVDETHGRIYAGTHGRGAFVLSKPFISNFEGWVNDSIWDIPVYGHNFLSNKNCTMSVLQTNGSVCASGSLDVMNGMIRTDAGGQLETSNGGMWSGKKVAWACFNGTCMGGVPISSCYDDADGDGDVDPLSTIVVNCEGQIATGTVVGCPPLNNPPSSFLTVAMAAGGGGGGGGPMALGTETTSAAEMPSGRARDVAGVLHLVASVQRRIGTAALCTVRVPYYAGETDEQVLERAQAAVNASATCSANNVHAELDRGHAGPGEDEFARVPRLLLNAPGVIGGQLITAIHTDPGTTTGACVRIDGVGVSVLQQLQVLKIGVNTLPAGAAGGTLTLVEHTPLGSCRLIIPIAQGQTRLQIAQAIVDAVHAPGIPGPHAECPSEINARDIVLRDGQLTSVQADMIELCTTDTNVGFDVRSEELANVYPVAEAGDDRVSPPGSPVALTGALSTDPDSTPGSHDDIASYEWFDVTSGSPVLIGNTEMLAVPLASGLHRLRLRVTDKGGLSDFDETLVSVEEGGGTAGAGGRWRGSLHVGSTHPLGDLASVSDANIHLRVDANYALRDRLRLVLFGGFSQMTAESAAAIEHPRYINASLDAQWLFPKPSGSAFFLEGGPGIYWPKSGGSAFGFDLGLGWQLPLRVPYRLELGADYHRVPGDDAQFVTVQFGVLFR
ncbi:MAG TPA: hypothetical protein VFN10_02465 [Thermoanaerobaculia bacterium]|nr:hypothetical protein [Thermoanaerobaculia bacterium]